jgi:putative transposase
MWKYAKIYRNMPMIVTIWSQGPHPIKMDQIWGVAQLSTTLEKEFCLEALRDSLQISRPEIFNTDRGVQFTSPEFTGLLERAGTRVSMEGRGRVYDNIFVERFWRSVKYEEAYLHEYRTVVEARAHRGAYFRFYNDERPHEALGYRTPYEVYFGSSAMLASLVEAVV